MHQYIIATADSIGPIFVWIIIIIGLLSPFILASSLKKDSKQDSPQSAPPVQTPPPEPLLSFSVTTNQIEAAGRCVTSTMSLSKQANEIVARDGWMREVIFLTGHYPRYARTIESHKDRNTTDVLEGAFRTEEIAHLEAANRKMGFEGLKSKLEKARLQSCGSAIPSIPTILTPQRNRILCYYKSSPLSDTDHDQIWKNALELSSIISENYPSSILVVVSTDSEAGKNKQWVNKIVFTCGQCGATNDISKEESFYHCTSCDFTHRVYFGYPKQNGDYWVSLYYIEPLKETKQTRAFCVPDFISIE